MEVPQYIPALLMQFYAIWLDRVAFGICIAIPLVKNGCLVVLLFCCFVVWLFCCFVVWLFCCFVGCWLSVVGCRLLVVGCLEDNTERSESNPGRSLGIITEEKRAVWKTVPDNMLLRLRLSPHVLKRFTDNTLSLQ